MNEKIFYAIVALLIIVASTAGYFFYQSNLAAVGAPADIVATSTSIATSSVPTQDDFSTLRTYTNTAGEFTFNYPRVMTVSEPTATSTESWNIEATSTGTHFVSVYLEREAFPQTNFSEGRFLVGRSKTASALKACLKVPEYVSSSTTTLSLNGRTFTAYNYMDAAAGSRYDTHVYSTVYDGYCYSISYVIHSTVLENYPPEAGIRQFDQSKVSALFEGIVQSFKFI